MKKKIIIISLVLLNVIQCFAQESTLTGTLVNRKYGFGYPSLTKKDNMGYPLIEVLVIPNIYEALTNMHFKAEYEYLVGAIIDTKWGYIDATGATKIPFKYEEASYFHEGLAPVKTNGKWGFINKTGATVIPFKYEYATSFEDGLSYVELGGKVGYINKTGTAVIPIKYEKQTDANNKHCVHCGPLYAFTNGKTTVVLNGKCGVIDTKGNFTECVDEAIDSTIFSGVVNAKKDRWGGNPGAAIKGTCDTKMDIKQIMLNGKDITGYISYESHMMYIAFVLDKLKAGDRVVIKIVHKKGSTFKLNDQQQGFDLGAGQENMVEKEVKQAGLSLDSTTFSGRINKDYASAFFETESKQNDIKRIYINDKDVTREIGGGARRIINFAVLKYKKGEKVTIKFIHIKGSTIKELEPKVID